MKINYVSQINPSLYDGGGEQTDRKLIEAGRARGHEIKIAAAWPAMKKDMFADPDLNILSNIYNQPAAHKRLPSALIHRIIDEQPFIHIDNAYVDVCDLPYLPCNGNTDGHSCRWKMNLGAQSHRLFKRHGCMAKTSRRMYTRSLLNVFVSPLHLRTIKQILGPNAIGNSFVVKPTIDTSVFFDRRLDRDIENLFVGALTEAKGMENIKHAFPDGNIVLVGPKGLGANPDFGHQVGKVDHALIPLYMNRARNFIFLPRWPEPMGRVIVEAALCGCKLIINENAGAATFDFDLRQPGHLEGATDEFWLQVEEVCLTVLYREALSS